MITEAIQSILADRDIKQALVDYIRADIKPVKDDWREVWRRKGTESLHLTVPDSDVTGMVRAMGGRGFRIVTLRIVAQWHEGKRCGVINGYMTDIEEHPWYHEGDGYLFTHEAVSAESYTEVIEEAQDAWGRLWTEFTAFVEKENLRLKAQVNT